MQSMILNVYAEAVKKITGHTLKLCTLAGSRSRVDLILDRLNTEYIDFCSVSTHVQNLSTPIRFSRKFTTTNHNAYHGANQ